ncbi:hypothetical protein GCM10028791_40440 [Echinicola sediminis]
MELLMDQCIHFVEPLKVKVLFFYFSDINGDGKADKIRWNKDEAPSGYSVGTLKNYLAE